jgi:hypothetical protein
MPLAQVPVSADASGDLIYASELIAHSSDANVYTVGECTVGVNFVLSFSNSLLKRLQVGALLHRLVPTEAPYIRALQHYQAPDLASDVAMV